MNNPSKVVLSDMEVFKKVWVIVFKYIYLVMLCVLAFRTTLLFINDNAEDVTIQSVALGLTIATVGVAFVAVLIAISAIKYKKK
ncbi:hypothetical protein H4J57_19265 [Colwellia sp. BRX8-7]|jgi:hypothetical protein|uniref:hypothetical protein n=1 Tax=Colwellia sp. BRX8-7 TaxID=2759833 RepID=UPI0015F45042|nr:hypothetical protein [Colwellia sp. BRX8-7]MBA6339327.1 hypothetical protein [Colwellia sp. BRX8-7]